MKFAIAALLIAAAAHAANTEAMTEAGASADMYLGRPSAPPGRFRGGARPPARVGTPGALPPYYNKHNRYGVKFQPRAGDPYRRKYNLYLASRITKDL